MLSTVISTEDTKEINLSMASASMKLMFWRRSDSSNNYINIVV